MPRLLAYHPDLLQRLRPQTMSDIVSMVLQLVKVGEDHTLFGCWLVLAGGTKAHSLLFSCAPPPPSPHCHPAGGCHTGSHSGHAAEPLLRCPPVPPPPTATLQVAAALDRTPVMRLSPYSGAPPSPLRPLPPCRWLPHWIALRSCGCALTPVHPMAPPPPTATPQVAAALDRTPVMPAVPCSSPAVSCIQDPVAPTAHHRDTFPYAVHNKFLSFGILSDAIMAGGRQGGRVEKACVWGQLLFMPCLHNGRGMSPIEMHHFLSSAAPAVMEAAQPSPSNTLFHDLRPWATGSGGGGTMAGCGNASSPACILSNHSITCNCPGQSARGPTSLPLVQYDSLLQQANGGAWDAPVVYLEAVVQVQGLPEEPSHRVESFVKECEAFFPGRAGEHSDPHSCDF